jgi:hypothetical protein
MCARRANPKGVECETQQMLTRDNNHAIDIINKIQPVIHFNKKSYNQKF